MTRLFVWTTTGVFFVLTTMAVPVFAHLATPDRISMTVQEAAISMDDITYITIFDSPVGVELDRISDPMFGKNEGVPAGTYKVLRLSVTEISWHATWSDTNLSPCDDSISGEATGLLDLGDQTLLFFKTPELGGNTLTYYQVNPPLSGYVGDDAHPFTLDSPVKVVTGGTTTVNLIIGVTQTLSCRGSITFFNREANGDDTPLRTISGLRTGLNGPQEVYLDTINDEIGVANSGNNSVTIYSRTDSGDIPPLRTIIGPATRLSGPAGIALYPDPDGDEVVVANSGNDSVTIYSRTASGNVAPLRTLGGTLTDLSSPAGIYVDTDNNEMGIANRDGGLLTFYSRPADLNSEPLYNIAGTQTGLSSPCRLYIDTVNSEIVVANAGNDSITIYNRNDVLVGVNGPIIIPVSETPFLSPLEDTFTDTETDFTPQPAYGIDTFADMIAAIESGETYIDVHTVGNPDGEIRGHIEARTLPHSLDAILNGNQVIPEVTTSLTGSALVTINEDHTEIEVTLDVTDTTNLIAAHIHFGSVVPKRTISGTSTGLSSPCGLYVDTVYDEIGVANNGNDSVTIYSRTDSGDIPPLRTIRGNTTGLNAPVGIVLDGLNNEIGVAQTGQNVVMAGQPPIIPSSTNVDISGSVLAGDYNVVFYGVNIEGVNAQGIAGAIVFAYRGTATFDPTTAPWPSFNFRFDTQIERRVITGCNVDHDIGVINSSIYGINSDGSFYLFIPEADGSVQGAFLPDGTAFVGSMVTSKNRLLLIYGVKSTGAFAPYLTSDGTSSGSAAHYAFTGYRNDLFTLPSAGVGNETLRYFLEIGMAETDNANVIGASGDSNFVTVLNPTGVSEAPRSSGAAYREKKILLRFQPYTSQSGGLLEIENDGLAGAATADGGILIYMRDAITIDDTNCPNDFGFGVGLRQRQAGTFSTESLKGTYFLAAFGDRFMGLYRSTAATLTFDGAGGVEMTLIENSEGMISVDRASFTYQVNSRSVPRSGDILMTVDVVDIFSRTTVAGPYASALIGEDGQSLAFFRNLNPSGDESIGNPTRILGLALFQHP